MKELYDMIFKRKSVRKFDETLFVTKEEMQKIKKQLELLIPLLDEIRIHFKIVEKSETTCKRGEYCLLMYSEEKSHFLLNVGYMLEQIDLFLASRNIGVCWYGFGKPKEMKIDGLEFVIMLAFGKSCPQDFRKDLMKCRRKECELIWKGNFDENIVNLVRYAPSSCNMQPWRVISENNYIKVYRTTDVKSIMPISKRPYYNSIDIGIFLCFLEIVLEHNEYQFKRTLNTEQNLNAEHIEIATYMIV